MSLTGKGRSAIGTSAELTAPSCKPTQMTASLPHLRKVEGAKQEGGNIASSAQPSERGNEIRGGRRKPLCVEKWLGRRGIKFSSEKNKKNNKRE